MTELGREKDSQNVKVLPVGRGERRKRETRTKLLRAAMGLMAERGLEAVAINEITEAADVGFGTFYNHFSSKEEIYTCIVTWVFEAFADALERSLTDVEDCAEVIAISIRTTMNHAKEDPLWGRFLVREGMSARSMRGGGGLAGRLNRDIARGLKSGRFRTGDPLMTFIAAGSTVLGGIVAELDTAENQQNGTPPIAGLTANLPERTAALVLKILGLGEEEALQIATAPLPPVSFTTAEIADY